MSKFEDFVSLIQATKIEVTKIEEPYVFTHCGIFQLDLVKNSIGFAPVSFLTAELSSILTATLAKMAVTLGYEHSIVPMKAVYPTDNSYTVFETDPVKVEELNRNTMKTMYGSSGIETTEDSSTIVTKPINRTQRKKDKTRI
jgi:hypothetical protein